ncbi:MULTISPECIES: hypothetical protein [unclassified Caballeronia]|uniref:hypothetical protein n=1 Tax=unclassified Caballeronia TaxID=2646786 RepID=UPI0020282ED6|nr:MULTISPECIES: hypothetical protein [unclassified Caballeronia]MDR5801271.1 hypothetical protein [Caballeronia sp. LZ001]
MNLHDQLGALESSLDTLLQSATSPDDQPAPLPMRVTSAEPVAPAAEPAPLGAEAEREQAARPAEKPTLTVSRPDRDAIEMTIAGQSVLLSPEGVSELIEELANVRASMTPDQPGGIAPGWRFAATKNPLMAVQKHANGDRLLIMRHGGHGWVPFTFSPHAVVEMYALLTKK